MDNMYTIGAICNNKEDYERLTRNHSRKGFCELSFRKVHENALFGRDEYPCLAVAAVDDYSPFSVFYSSKVESIVDDGFSVVITKEG